MSTEHEAQATASRLELLRRFVHDNPRLEELTGLITGFNLFRVLRIEHAEIRHSNVLAWLFDPRGSHGLGDVVLQRVLTEIILDNEAPIDSLSPSQIARMDLAGAEVWREWKNTDLVAISRANGWVLLVENKIQAPASTSQLLGYLDIVRAAFPRYTIVPVLLTLDQDEALELADAAGFLSWSHAQWCRVLSDVIEQAEPRISPDVRTFLNHYLVSLRRLTMQDEELVNLCKAIYQEHRVAIDLIVELAGTSEFQAALAGFLADHHDLVQLSLDHRQLWFIPEGWKGTMPSCPNTWTHLSEPYPVACWFAFHSKDPKLGFVIEVGSARHPERRLALVKAFVGAGFSVGRGAFQPEAQYTRIHSMYQKAVDPHDQEKLRGRMEELWRQGERAVHSATEVIRAFDWQGWQ